MVYSLLWKDVKEVDSNGTVTNVPRLLIQDPIYYDLSDWGWNRQDSEKAMSMSATSEAGGQLMFLHKVKNSYLYGTVLCDFNSMPNPANSYQCLDCPTGYFSATV